MLGHSLGWCDDAIRDGLLIGNRFGSVAFAGLRREIPGNTEPPRDGLTVGNSSVEADGPTSCCSVSVSLAGRHLDRREEIAPAGPRRPRRRKNQSARTAPTPAAGGWRLVCALVCILAHHVSCDGTPDGGECRTKGARQTTATDAARRVMPPTGSWPARGYMSSIFHFTTHT
ncbi:sugar transporter [Anopheles sinensis]|uniref:Sugar transporter n=1 Tax=Anopheles sinensis TaxID=74873 RepID=A0A084VGP0_ANOSI|nr:sugar transporter [Anopheles sinensis]